MCVIRDLSLCNHWQGELLSCVGQGIRPSGFLERSDCQLPLNTGGPVCIWALPFACHKVLMAGSLLHPKALKLAICKVGVGDQASCSSVGDSPNYKATIQSPAQGHLRKEKQ